MPGPRDGPGQAPWCTDACPRGPRTRQRGPNVFFFMQLPAASSATVPAQHSVATEATDAPCHAREGASCVRHHASACQVPRWRAPRARASGPPRSRADEGRLPAPHPSSALARERREGERNGRMCPSPPPARHIFFSSYSDAVAGKG
ncbi:unnamed protein product [Prorocentrum cordatum]|uniref:Uncharacterized protein n=1 Tax=Prorocentrum cordatum TaxID=2364126 RepID=A0ABN9Y3U9_9DINO|nr:unnamed protein product [Polarella glacialis]